MTTNIKELPKAYNSADVEEKCLDVKNDMISFVPKRKHMYPKGDN